LNKYITSVVFDPRSKICFGSSMVHIPNVSLKSNGLSITVDEVEKILAEKEHFAMEKGHLAMEKGHLAMMEEGYSKTVEKLSQSMDQAMKEMEEDDKKKRKDDNPKREDDKKKKGERGQDGYTETNDTQNKQRYDYKGAQFTRKIILQSDVVASSHHSNTKKRGLYVKYILGSK